MRREGRPAGTPIGRSLNVPAGIAYDELREAIAAIDRVHGDGDLPPLPVRLVTGIAARGRFRFDPTNGPISISVRAHQTNAGFILAHEIGHLLDLGPLGADGSFGSIVNRLMQPWLLIVMQSRAHRALAAMALHGKAEPHGMDGSQFPLTLGEDEMVAVRAALRAEELWARTYAQFVAIRSGHPTLMRSLNALRTRSLGKVYYPRQWDEADFEPIDDAIDVLMRNLGWRA